MQFERRDGADISTVGALNSDYHTCIMPRCQVRFFRHDVRIFISIRAQSRSGGLGGVWAALCVGRLGERDRFFLQCSVHPTPSMIIAVNYGCGRTDNRRERDQPTVTKSVSNVGRGTVNETALISVVFKGLCCRLSRLKILCK